MKKISILLLALVMCIGVSAQEKKGVNFENLTLSEAIAKAKSNKKGPKMVFLDCYTTWCGPCKYMAEQIFPQKAAGDYFNANFINLKIDMEKGEGIDIAKKYKISAFPTFLIFDSEGKEIGRLVGGGELNNFIKRVKTFADPTCSPAALKAVYDAEKTFTNAAAYMDALSYSSKAEEASKFFNDEFESFDDREKFTENFFNYAARSISSKDSKVLDFVVTRKYAYDLSVGRKKVNDALVNAYKNIIFDYVSGKQTLSKEEADRMVSSLSLLNEDDEVAKFYVIIGHHYANNEMERIVNLFHLGAFSFYSTDMDKSQIERLFIAVKGMPKAKIREYYEGKAEIYKSNVASFEKQAERYKEE